MKVIPKFTMISPIRLVHLYNLVEEINSRHLPGDVVECGVWNAGSSAIMWKAHQECNPRSLARTLWLFDSFAGMPPPGEKEEKSLKNSFFPGLNKGQIRNAEKIFKKLKLDMKNVKIVPGWFDQTLPENKIEKIALLHVDSDWYESVKIVLDSYYHNVVPGGFVVIDDYGTLSGCRQAVHDFLNENRLQNIKLKKVDRSAVYFQKKYN